VAVASCLALHARIVYRHGAPSAKQDLLPILVDSVLDARACLKTVENAILTSAQAARRRAGF